MQISDRCCFLALRDGVDGGRRYANDDDFDDGYKELERQLGMGSEGRDISFIWIMVNDDELALVWIPLLLKG